MSLVQILLMLLAGVVSSNCVVSSAVGVELSLSGTNSIKNATYYSIVIFVVTLLSFLSCIALSFILESLGISQFLFVAEIFIVAILVQIAEFVCSKLFPLFLKETYGFVTSICLSAFVLLAGTYFTNLSVGISLLQIFFECLGVWFILLLISGIRSSRKYLNLPDYLKGNTLNIIILVVLFVVMYAMV